MSRDDREPVPMPRGSPADARETERGTGDVVDAAVRRAGRAIYDRSARFRDPLRRARSLYAEAYVRSAALRYNLVHAAPIDPFRVRWVDPERVARLSEPTSRSRFRRIAEVEGGEWDRCSLLFRETDVFYAFRRHFLEGVPWAETAFFDRVVGEIAAGEERWGCTTPADFAERCRRIDRLYESIRERGFRSQRELHESEADTIEGDRPVDHDRPRLTDRIVNDEIAVDVARDGELLFADGRNRLAIAKVLDVDAVPVLVLRRHARWVAVRDAVAERSDRDLPRQHRDLPRRLREHPDLAPLFETA